MYIKRLTATFGRLENETLELKPGLNIIQAPNEGGKSTWTAFLRVMLYGINTRDRSPEADKRKYLPWGGSPMQGAMELETKDGGVTVTRRTARANSPMGAFSATYTGTGEAVPGLTAGECGEQLLGIPLDVFERSAYIRQSGIAVDQSAALERRIAALITTGEEDTSFSAATERLKKQLTRRRYNRSGILPQLEQEIGSLQTTLQDADRLKAQLEQAQTRERELELLRTKLQRALARHDDADRAEQAARAREAQKAHIEAGAKLEQLRQRTAALPPKAELETLLGRMDALDAARTSEDNFAKSVFESETHLRRATEALEGHPLGQYSPSQAEQLPLEEGPRPAPMPVWFGPGAVLAGLALYFLISHSGAGWMPALGAGLGLSAVLLLAAALPRIKKQQAWDERHRELLARRQELLEEYYILYGEAQAAQDALRGAEAARSGARQSREAQWAQLTELVAQLDSTAHTPEAARNAVKAAIALHRAAEEGAAQAERARMQWELLAQQLGEVPEEMPLRPTLSREELLRQDRAAEEEQILLRRHIHTGQGRAQALGDSAQLTSQMEVLEEKRRQTQLEYDAIALAMDTLSDANSRLQSRFSPALGEKSANFFTKLTKGKYNKVLLDRQMNPSAQEAGQFLPREIALLSRGAADQLYLAVRLAICQLVLPEEEAAPILLDDALVSFDDRRCAAALEVLAELGQQRQILLFTCQSREAALLEQMAPGRHNIIKREQT